MTHWHDTMVDRGHLHMIIFRAVAVIAIGLATAGFDRWAPYTPIYGLAPPVVHATRSADPARVYPSAVPIYPSSYGAEFW